MDVTTLQGQAQALFPVPPARAHELALMPYDQYLRQPEWYARRKAKIIEAGHRCLTCNSSKSLEVHHRTYQRRGNEIRSDLTVLCRRCHSLIHERPPVDLFTATEPEAA